MSSQRGEHWDRYILPHVEQYTETRSFMEGFKDGAKGSVDLSGLAEAWFWGAVKTLLSPAIPAILDMANVDRPRFYYSEGVTDIDRAKAMLTGWIGTAYIANVVLLAFFYVYTIKGARAWLMVYCVVVVLITGPVGYAKYRIIMEPMLCLMAGMGVENDLEPRRTWI